MVVDALLEADPVLRLTDRIWDVNQFVALDDSVLEVRVIFFWFAGHGFILGGKRASPAVVRLGAGPWGWW